ncbi:MAG: hypothetical protein GY754_39295 [bacterium]|nr:hypothetical protein [bacterium]
MITMSKSEVEIDPIISEVLDTYYSLGGTRNREGLEEFLNVGLGYITLPGVDPGLREQAVNAKHLFVLWDVFLDDVVDTYKNMTLARSMLSSAFQLKEEDLAVISPDDREWFFTYCRIREDFFDMIGNFPRFEQFKTIIEYDIKQFLNCIEYSFLIFENPHLINLNEHHLYVSHNMNLMIFSTIDLMCSPEFSLADLSILRRAAWEGQYMTRIDNDLSTWEREVQEGDFSSSVLALAIEKGVLHCDEIVSGKFEANNAHAIIEEIKNSAVLDELYADWENRKLKIIEFSEKCETIDIESYLDGLVKVQELYGKSKKIV